MPAAKALIESFYDLHQPEPNSGCWLWTGATNSKGYGNLRGRMAHRTGYELLVGAVPSGLQLDHLCRTRRCVNPAHVEPVTPSENTRRGYGPGGLNARKTLCPQGHPYDRVKPWKNNNRGCRRCWTAAHYRRSKQ